MPGAPGGRGLSPIAPVSTGNQYLAVGYCVLLALQFGLQPTLVKTFTPNSISKKTIVITTEVSKILITVASLVGASSKKERAEIFKDWTIKDSLKQAAVPAILYALQNVLTQYGYSMLDSMTFNLLNQTKILSSAFCLWIVLKQPQSLRQVFALLILLQAAILLSLPKDIMSTVAESSFALVDIITTHMKNYDIGNALHAASGLPRKIIGALASSAHSANIGVSGQTYRNGVLMVVGASALSGISTALTQRSLQTAKRNALFYSAEMAVYGIIALLLSSIKSGFDSKGGLYVDYTSGIEELTKGVSLDDIPKWSKSPMWVMIPIIVNVSLAVSLAAVQNLELGPISPPLSPSLSLDPNPHAQAFGGLIVGLVTKYAGGVNKGFAIIAGLFLSGVVQWVHEKKPLGPFDLVAAAMVTFSLYLHQTKGWGSAAPDKKLESAKVKTN